MEKYSLSLYEVLSLLYEEAYLEGFHTYHDSGSEHSYAFRTLMEIIGELDKFDDFKKYLDNSQQWLSYTESEEVIAMCKAECDRLEDYYNGTLYAEDTDFEETEGN